MVKQAGILLAGGGEGRQDLAIGTRFVDVLGHGWDAVVSIGAPYRPDDELASTALAITSGGRTPVSAVASSERLHVLLEGFQGTANPREFENSLRPVDQRAGEF